MATVPCPACSEPLAIPVAKAGKRVKCSVCKQAFLAPPAEPVLDDPPLGSARCAKVAFWCGVAAIAYPACITGPIAALAAIVLGILGIRSNSLAYAMGGIFFGVLALVVFGWFVVNGMQLWQMFTF